MKTYIRSKDWREKISKALSGRRLSSEHKKNLSLSHANPPAETRTKIGLARKGKEWTKEIRLKMSKSQSKRVAEGRHWSWKGGITPINHILRNSIEYKLWRESVFKKDSYTCVWCKDDRGHNLEADHIKPFALYPNLRFTISNGRTLCVDCHKSTDTWGRKNENINFILKGGENK